MVKNESKLYCLLLRCFNFLTLRKITWANESMQNRDSEIPKRHDVTMDSENVDVISYLTHFTCHYGMSVMGVQKRFEKIIKRNF